MAGPVPGTIGDTVRQEVMIQLDEKDLELLIETAYLGLNQGCPQEAEAMFGELRELAPDNPHPLIGLAILRYSQRRVMEAISLLRAVLDLFPQAVFTRALLAQLMKEAGQAGWQSLAKEAIDLDENGIAASMASALFSGETAQTPVHGQNQNPIGQGVQPSPFSGVSSFRRA